MSEDVLQSFVVALGFKMDQQGQRKMEAGIASVAKAAEGLSLALGAAAVAAAAAVTKIAAGFDTLYFSSQRTGASVQNIKALQYAFSQVGSSSEAAAGAIEAYAKAIRTNPGVGQYVKDLGVKQTGDAFNDLSAAIDKIQAKNPYYAGAQMAGLLGISEEQYQTFTKYRKEIATYRAEYDKFTKQFGLNNDEAAKSSASFMRGLNSLGTLATVVGQKFLVALAPAFDRVVKGILAWIDANPEKIERIFNAIATAGEWVSKAFDTVWKAGVQLFDFLSAKAQELNSDGSFLRMWEKVATVFDRVAAAIKSVLTWVRELDRATDMSAGLNTIKRLLGWVEGKTTGFVEGGAAAAGAIDRATDTGVGVAGGGGKPNLLQRGWEAAKRAVGLGSPEKPAGPLGKIGQNRNAQTIIRTLRDAGYGENAIAAVVGSMQTESSFNPRAANSVSGGHTGLWQWDRNRWPRVERWIKSQGGDPYDAGWQTKAWIAEHNAKPGDPMYDHRRTQRGGEILRSNPSIEDAIHGVRESERFGPGEEGGRANNARRWLPNVRQAAQPAPTAPPPMARSFNPGSFDVNALGSQPLGSNTVNNAGAQVTMAPVTNIKIDGANDPASVGAAVERAQGRANDLSLRNVQAAIR